MLIDAIVPVRSRPKEIIQNAEADPYSSDQECVMAKLKNIHPGEILLEEFLIPMGMPECAGACDQRAAAPDQ